MIVFRQISPALRRPILTLLAGALLPGSSLAEPARAEPAPSTKARPDPALRVATIGYRLALAAAPRCQAQTMLTGLVLHDRAAYDEQARAGLAGLGWGFGVRGVVPGSPAAEAGLHAGDEIVAVEGQDLRDYRPDLAGRSGTFARTEAFTALLAATLQVSPAQLRIVHQSQGIAASGPEPRSEPESVILMPQRPGCSIAFTLVPGRSPDAWTDGRYLAVTEAMEQRTSEDALAFAIAHELAHVVLAHAEQPERPFAAIGIGAGHVRNEEVEADRLAVHLLQAGGYDPRGGVQLFDILRIGSFLRFGPTHPSLRARAAAVNAEIAGLEAQSARNH